MNNIKKLREDFGLSQQELADKLNLAKSSISMYENSNRLPSLEVLQKMSSYFNVSIDYILGNTLIQNPKEELEMKLNLLTLNNNELNLILVLAKKYFINSESINLKNYDEKIKKGFYEISKIFNNYADNEYSSKGSIRFSKEQIEGLIYSLDYKKIINGIANKGIKIPILGKVIAGQPIEAIEDIIGYETITQKLAETGDFFCLIVKGKSMEPNFIEGDIVVVRKQSDVESGDIAVVLVNGDEATIKKVIKKENGIILQPRNPEYEPIFYANKQIKTLPVQILGKAMEVRRKLY